MDFLSSVLYFALLVAVCVIVVFCVLSILGKIEAHKERERLKRNIAQMNDFEISLFLMYLRKAKTMRWYASL